jgi:hypothetical protein
LVELIRAEWPEHKASACVGYHATASVETTDNNAETVHVAHEDDGPLSWPKPTVTATDVSRPKPTVVKTMDNGAEAAPVVDEYGGPSSWLKPTVAVDRVSWTKPTAANIMDNGADGMYLVDKDGDHYRGKSLMLLHPMCHGRSLLWSRHRTMAPKRCACG